MCFFSVDGTAKGAGVLLNVLQQFPVFRLGQSGILPDQFQSRRLGLLEDGHIRTEIGDTDGRETVLTVSEEVTGMQMKTVVPISL